MAGFARNATHPWRISDEGVEVMAKVNKAYSIDPETFMMLERYCAASETWDKKKSRSKVVNDAIKWFLSGDVANQIHSHEALLERYREVCIELAQYKESSERSSQRISNRTWWRRLLGLN